MIHGIFESWILVLIFGLKTAQQGFRN